MRTSGPHATWLIATGAPKFPPTTQSSQVSAAPAVATNQYCEPKDKTSGEVGVTLSIAVQQAPLETKGGSPPLKVQLIRMEPGRPPLSEFSVNTGPEFVPAVQVREMSIWVRSKFADGVKPIAALKATQAALFTPDTVNPEQQTSAKLL